MYSKIAFHAPLMSTTDGGGRETAKDHSVSVEPEGSGIYEVHFHSAPAGYLVTDPDGTILDVNETFARWLERTRAELLGTSMLKLLPVADRVVYTSHAAMQLGVSGSFDEMTASFLTAGGGRLPVLLSGVRSEAPDPVSEDGAGLDRLTVFRAPKRTRYEQELAAALRAAEAAETARAAAEERLLEKQRALEEKDRILERSLRTSRQREALLDTIFNTADVGLLVVDGEGTTVLTNSHLATALQRNGAQAGGNLNRLPIFHADQVTPLAEEERPVRRAAAGEAFSNQIIWFGNGDNRMALSVSARPVLDGRETGGSVLAFSDVTRLVRAAAAQEEFVANVSHELRTPLTSILGYLDMVREDNLPEHVDSALEIATRNAERLLDLVTDLLSVASGTPKAERKTVDMAALVRAAAVAAAPAARANGLELITDVPHTALANVDPQRINQVLDNLLSNAVKYSPDGGRISVRLLRSGPDVTLEVADTGIGMSEAEQKQVFTRFFRSRKALSSAIPGAGLGLAITKSIVESHGGRLHFRSRAGEGSVFTAVFPDAWTEPPKAAQDQCQPRTAPVP